MAFLTADEKNRIRQAIEDVERQTAGELVTVIAWQSDDYLYIPTLWAALFALAVPGVIGYLPFDTLIAHSYLAQFSVFIVLAMLFQWPPLKMRLIPRSIKIQRARRLAHVQFLAQDLHHTTQRMGILLFVSMAERYVEIIADKGINDAVEAGTWDRIVNQFVGNVKQGQVAGGFISAIQQCGEVLIAHFPVAANDKNELPDHLIQL
jgi:putative membrane protein